jgi:DNA gyrase subunit A
MKVYNDEIKKIMRILLDPKKIDEVIIEEMLAIKAKYNDAKKCKIISRSQIKGVASGTFKLVIMKNNYIKKMNEGDMVPPSQMGKVNLIILADNAEDIIVFSALGKAFKVPIHKIPISDPNSDGTDIRLLNKYCTANVIGVARESTLKALCSSKVKNFIYTVTQQGFIKKIDIEDVVNCPASGIIYARVDPGDYMQAVIFGPSKMDLLFYTSNKIIRLNPKEVPYLRRSTKGSRVSTPTTTIDGMNFILPQATDLVVITKNGYVNRLPVANIEKVTRGRAGIPVIKLSKGDSIHTVWTCTPNAKLIVREARSQKEIPVESLDMASTVSSGKMLFQDVTKVFLAY